MHPYMAQGVAEEHIADFLRAAQATRQGRDGAQPRSRRHGLRRRPAGSRPGRGPARLVLAHSGAVGADNNQDRSAELCGAAR